VFYAVYHLEELPWWNWKKLKIVLKNGTVTSYGPDQK